MEASPVDIRENWSMDGSEERTAEERADGEGGFQIVAGTDRVKCRSEGGSRSS